jgi:hypothetical protein
VLVYSVFLLRKTDQNGMAFALRSVMPQGREQLQEVIKLLELRLVNYRKNLEACSTDDRHSFDLLIQQAERDLVHLKAQQSSLSRESKNPSDLHT